MVNWEKEKRRVKNMYREKKNLEKEKTRNK